LKATFAEDDDQERDSSLQDGLDANASGLETSSLLVRETNIVTQEYLLQAVPPKELSDGILEHWFDPTNLILRKYNLIISVKTSLYRRSGDS
jgi:hypothetical protein